MKKPTPPPAPDPTLLERARKNYPNNKAYQEAWVKSVTLLGPKWLLARNVGRVS